MRRISCSQTSWSIDQRGMIGTGCRAWGYPHKMPCADCSPLGTDLQGTYGSSHRKSLAPKRYRSRSLHRMAYIQSWAGSFLRKPVQLQRSLDCTCGIHRRSSHLRGSCGIQRCRACSRRTCRKRSAGRSMVQVQHRQSARLGAMHVRLP